MIVMFDPDHGCLRRGYVVATENRTLDPYFYSYFYLTAPPISNPVYMDFFSPLG